MASCPIPVCTACLYGKATKCPWHGKKTNKASSDVLPVIRSGQVVSVDQLVSPTTGLIAQMSGFLTTKRYQYATIFVDNFSGLSFVWLQKSPNAEETVEAKQAFEIYCTSHGVSVEHYHADNGIFNAYAWRAACIQKGQGLTFAGVNAIIKMDRQRDKSDHSRTKHGPCSFTPITGGQVPSQLTYGHMLYAWQMTLSTQHPAYKTRSKGLPYRFSAAQRCP